MTDNELIAQFMGGLKGDADSDVSDLWYFGDRHAKYLRYDSSWDWLMPVVQKIEKMTNVSVIIKGSRCRILVGKKVFSCHTISKLNSMYRVVVEFIVWLKQNQSC